MKRTATFALVLSALLVAAGHAGAEEAEYLRLRPHKQPSNCVGSSTEKCPQVEAPRINKQRSTIPGVAHPDFGRPPVMVLPPPRPRVVAPYRSFGGNRGVTGGM